MFIPGWREGQGLPTGLYPVSLCQSEGYEDIRQTEKGFAFSYFFSFSFGMVRSQENSADFTG